jgi:ribosomal protein S27E
MSTINIRSISIKCGNCNTYQTLTAFARSGEMNVYTYECENQICDPTVTRTLVEVPRELDAFARRDVNWRGGGRHGAEGDGTPEA